ncbi:MAG TPA: cytochrome c oxidase subunit 4 [Mycobacteriales bacterium]|nr:cytochrome c oxidase subunit 4 [Mycobacteriales bacterium]
MRVEARLFLLLCGLLFAFAIVYGLWTWADSGRVEVAGTTALVLSGGLCLIIGSYFWFVARRIDLRPEDRTDADIAEGAGELGFFSPGSYWPVTLALSAAIAGLGLVFFEAWLIGLGIVAVLVSVGGLLFEYYASGHTSPTI